MFILYFQVKDYDINSNIYLNYIECEYGLLNDIDGSRLYLVSSRVKEKNSNSKINVTKKFNKRLVDIEITQTSAQSPTLSLIHDNVLTKIDMKMSSIEFVLNVMAFRNIIKFFEVFTENLVYTKNKKVDNYDKVRFFF